MAGESILARPTGRVERAVKWLKRLPGVAALAAVTERLNEKQRRLDEALARVRETETRFNILTAQTYWERGNATLARRLLTAVAPADRRWEWHHLDRSFGGEAAILEGCVGAAALEAWLSPDRQSVAVRAGDDLRVRHTVSGRTAVTLRLPAGPVNHVAWSPDGNRLATVANGDPAVRVWDLRAGREQVVVRATNGSAAIMAWSPDGTAVASAWSEGFVIVFDAATGGVSANFATPDCMGTCIAWSPDGRRLAVGGFTGTGWIGDAATGQASVAIHGHTMVGAVAWSPDGTRVATSDCLDATVRTWDAATGRPLATCERVGRGTFAVAWSPDGRRLATAAEDETVRVWDADAGTELAVFRGHVPAAFGLWWSTDGRALRTADAGRGREWPVEEPAADVAARAGVAPPDVSPDGRWAIDLEDRLVPRVVCRSSRAARCECRGHTEIAFRVAWSPDGGRLASAGLDGTARTWDAATGRELTAFHGHANKVSGVAWSPAGDRVATTSLDGTARVWEAATGREVTVDRHSVPPTSPVAWSPDGRRVATAGRDRMVYLWDAADGVLRRTLAGHAAHVLDTAWSPDGSRLATVAADDTARAWDSLTGQELLALPTGNGGTSVAWSPDGRWLVAFGPDGETLAWDGPPCRRP